LNSGSQLWKKMLSLIFFKEEKKKEELFLFTIEKQKRQQVEQGEQKNKLEDKVKSKKQFRVKKKIIEAGQQKENKKKRASFKKPVRVNKTPLSFAELKKKKQEKNKFAREPFIPEKLVVSSSLESNKYYVEQIYSLPKNKDIILREFYLALDSPLKAFMLFIDGLAEKEIINNSILKPLMVLLDGVQIEGNEIATYIKEHLLPGHDVQVLEEYRQILDFVNYGNTAIFVEGCAQCLVVETKGWDKRSVDKPEVEQVIMGPHEAFNETLRSNTALIRKALRNENLITEMVKVGARNKIDVAIMYLEDLTNPQLVKEVKRRIISIKTDYVGVSGVLEQFIEDEPFRLSPQILTTERPDRVVSFLVEGYVTVIVDGAPQALIVPVTLFSLLHSSEDYYLRLPYGNFLRILRVLALFITILTPGIYVAIVTFHQEMIPTELLLAIAASRATVPFPTIFEVFAMEFAFELIREAGVRVPGVIGNTIGIVGALILGQAAVQAGIVSPILIIVIAITGLASFAIPNYSLSFSFRGRRFIFTVLAASFGFFGIAGGLFFFLITLVNMKSFGVPFLAPISPKIKTGPDVVWRGPVWSMEERVDYLAPLDRRRQPNISRGWIKKPRGGKTR
jgi:spore germination protein KA